MLSPEKQKNILIKGAKSPKGRSPLTSQLEAPATCAAATPKRCLEQQKLGNWWPYPLVN